MIIFRQLFHGVSVCSCFNLAGKIRAVVVFWASTFVSLTALGATPGTNPIITDVYTADPAPLVVGNTVYLYTGHDEPNSSFYTMNNWRCYSSQDMTNWTSYGSILSYTNFTWASGSAWAGQCVGPINGRFYWYVPMQGAAVTADLTSAWPCRTARPGRSTMRAAHR